MAGHGDRSVLVKNLVGTQEIADRIGVAHRQTVITWSKRYDDFPTPLLRLNKAWVWDWLDIEAWAKKTGRL
jgi:hypothetical protein